MKEVIAIVVAIGGWAFLVSAPIAFVVGVVVASVDGACPYTSRAAYHPAYLAACWLFEHVEVPK